MKYFMLILLFLVSCYNYSYVYSIKYPTQQSQKQKIILITLDGVRWQEIFYGTDKNLTKQKLTARKLLPNLYTYFVDEGIVIGKNSKMITSAKAHLSLPGYLEIMRGHSVDCMSNDCDTKPEKTIANQFSEVAVFSSWVTIKRTIDNQSSMVMNCGKNYRSTEWRNLQLPDYNSGAFFYNPNYREDAITEMQSLEYFNLYSPDFFWIALGDTDEYAHLGNYQKYIDSLIAADAFIGRIVAMAGVEYSIIVTTDHGRSYNWATHGQETASARVWAMIRGANVTPKGFVSYDKTKTLSDIYPTILALVENKSGGLL